MGQATSRHNPGVGIQTKRFEFHALSNRAVIAQFDGGDISSDAGGLLLREVEQRTGILKQFAKCFHRLSKTGMD